MTVHVRFIGFSCNPLEIDCPSRESDAAAHCRPSFHHLISEVTLLEICDWQYSVSAPATCRSIRRVAPVGKGRLSGRASGLVLLSTSRNIHINRIRSARPRWQRSRAHLRFLRTIGNQQRSSHPSMLPRPTSRRVTARAACPVWIGRHLYLSYRFCRTKQLRQKLVPKPLGRGDVMACWLNDIGVRSSQPHWGEADPPWRVPIHRSENRRQHAPSRGVSVFGDSPQSLPPMDSWNEFASHDISQQQPDCG
jgi:hypothetical protein